MPSVCPSFTVNKYICTIGRASKVCRYLWTKILSYCGVFSLEKPSIQSHKVRVSIQSDKHGDKSVLWLLEMGGTVVLQKVQQTSINQTVWKRFCHQLKYLKTFIFLSIVLRVRLLIPFPPMYADMTALRMKESFIKSELKFYGTLVLGLKWNMRLCLLMMSLLGQSMLMIQRKGNSWIKADLYLLLNIMFCKINPAIMHIWIFLIPTFHYSIGTAVFIYYR